MPYFSDEKRYRKNSNGFELQEPIEEQLVNFSRKSEIKNRFRRYRVNNTTIFIHKFTLSLICF